MEEEGKKCLLSYVGGKIKTKKKKNLPTCIANQQRSRALSAANSSATSTLFASTTSSLLREEEEEEEAEDDEAAAARTRRLRRRKRHDAATRCVVVVVVINDDVGVGTRARRAFRAYVLACAAGAAVATLTLRIAAAGREERRAAIEGDDRARIWNRKKQEGMLYYKLKEKREREREKK